ncbi:MAG: 50S ribosomal protein L22 [Alphaproteobacteria bacterium]|jgi:large subunit ribosomal protein L22|nr:50S ribosomal protein L22 [Alphaproteobacteria bacterium]
MVEKRYGIKDNEARAFLRMVKGSPQKLNLVAQSIRGLSADKAIEQLTFSKKRVALDVKKLVLSAVSNAEHNYKLDIDKLYVKEAYVGKALVMKRFHARARGRGAAILKPFSNMTVVVAERVAPAKKEVKNSKPKTEKKEAK